MSRSVEPDPLQRELESLERALPTLKELQQDLKLSQKRLELSQRRLPFTNRPDGSPGVLSGVTGKLEAKFEAQLAERVAELTAFIALPRIEQCAVTLAKLEQEWSVLGPMREITFMINGYGEAEAESLAQDAREAGFSVVAKVSSEVDEAYGDVPFCLHARRLMEPTAANVTQWEEWFLTRIEKIGATFEGWSYPKRLRPSFSLENGRGAIRSREGEASASFARCSVLFGRTLCDFQASNGWSSRGRERRSAPTFKLVPTEFLAKAKRRRPVDPEPSASKFAQWLYSLYSSAHGDEADRDAGSAAEEKVLSARQRAFSSADERTLRKGFPDWRLKHNGMTLGGAREHSFFEINDLAVGGKPLRVLPDLVYENCSTREIIIVEVKHSGMDIPDNLWPNIWGQLWCYSQIHEVRDAPKVTVVGEVWGDLYGRRDPVSVYLRASVRRDPRKAAYDRFFRTLFDVYRGSV